jgi:hypothetical protein
MQGSGDVTICLSYPTLVSHIHLVREIYTECNARSILISSCEGLFLLPLTSKVCTRIFI